MIHRTPAATTHSTFRIPHSPFCLLFSVIPLVIALAPLAQAQVTVSAFEARNRMVDEEIVDAGLKNARVIAAMRATPRHEFVALNERQFAYFDMALPIGEGQTISPPFIVAYMTEQLDPQPTDKVLEIGTGSGYQAAILSPLVKEVYSIEIKEALGKNAARTLKRLGYTSRNVFTKIGDGYQGWPEHAPFDKIIVTCSPENVPQALVDQLRDGGRLIVPLGERFQQTLYLFRKQGGKLVSEALRATLFVPMTGTAESERKVKPDPLNPALINGGFEETRTEGSTEMPRGWHYLRQGKIVKDSLAPEGEHYVTFTNSEPGRGASGLASLRHRRPQSHHARCLIASAGQRRAARPKRPAITGVGDHLLRRQAEHDRRAIARAVARDVRLADRTWHADGAPQGGHRHLAHRPVRRRRRSFVRQCPARAGDGEEVVSIQQSVGNKGSAHRCRDSCWLLTTEY